MKELLAENSLSLYFLSSLLVLYLKTIHLIVTKRVATEKAGASSISTLALRTFWEQELWYSDLTQRSKSRETYLDCNVSASGLFFNFGGEKHHNEHDCLETWYFQHRIVRHWCEYQETKLKSCHLKN